MPDYVIVGAGSAGCVLAARLSEDPSVDVLLIEAGGSDRHPNVKIPAAFAKQFKSKRDWDLGTEPEPEPHCNGRSIYMPRGKGLGGSSSMNAMLYVRGHPLDYEKWAAGGATGWDWDGIRPYFLRAEDNSRGESEHHAIDGPLRVEDERSPRHLTRQFLDSCAETGIPRIADYNGHEQDGPSDKPRILTNSLAVPEDVAALVAGARLAREIATAEPFASVLGRELFPGTDVDSDEDLADDLRNRVELLYHPVGTCRMGSDDEAVVDPELRVRGFDGLRVADASVFPIIPSGNTNAPTIAVAERAADLIAGKPLLRDDATTGITASE